MHPLMPLHLFIGVVGIVLLALCLHFGLPRAALLVTVVCAYSWGALLVESVSRVPGWLRRLHYRRWEGRYHEYDGRQIRVEEGADGEPWAVLDDALAAMGLGRAGLRLGGLSPLEYRQPEGSPELVSLAGIAKLSAVARGDTGARFERWFSREVHLPAMKRLAQARGG